MSNKIRLFITRGVLTCFITILSFAGVAPVLVMAEGTACTPPATDSGVHRPVGADSSLYTYDCASGKWVSAHFIYDPATAQTTPIDPIVYTYNPSTGLYDSPTWAFNAPTNSYVQRTVSVSQPPAGAQVIGAPAPASAPTGSTAGSSGGTGGTQSISDTGSGSNNTITNSGGTGGSQTINGTGSNSNNSISGSNGSELNVSNGSTLTMNNNLATTAASGNADLLSNTVGGNVTTGNAQDLLNVVNMLQSAASSLGSGNVVTFVKNIDGNVNGDIMLDPALLAGTGTVQAASSPLGNNTVLVNNQVGAVINNNIDLTASSGNTTASKNTEVGNASSGSAQAIANVLNLINSAIGAGQSFIGTININGNLNGDILVPPQFIDQLLAANVPTVTITATGPTSNNTVTNNNSTTTQATNTNNLGINNVITALATSGQVTATQNTQTGNLASGSTNTGITAFNLTGSNVLGKNDILVFVNVLGKWVGMIVNAPRGATAAELGGGIISATNTGPNSNNNVTNTNNNSTSFNNNAALQINNNILAKAASGNVDLTKNTLAGNALSGDAKVAVNLMNIENSTFSLSDWFGILFINVFGSWNGSFGINTSAGDPPPSLAAALDPPAAHNVSGSWSSAAPPVFRFAPHSRGPNGHTGGGSASSHQGDNSNNYDLVAASTGLGGGYGAGAGSGDPAAPPAQHLPQHGMGLKPAAIAGLTFVIVAGDTYFSVRKERRQKAAELAAVSQLKLLRQ